MSENVENAISEILEMLDFINAHGGFAEYNDYSDLHDAISLIPCNDWISVDGTPPKKAGEYIVAYHPCHWNEIDYSRVLVGLDSFRGKEKWAKDKYRKVIAWMEKPKPPEVKE